MTAPPRHHITLRVTPNVHTAMKRRADADGLPLNRWIMETCLLRIGWGLGVEAGIADVGGAAVPVDEALRAAVRDILREWGEPDPRNDKEPPHSEE